MGCGRFYDSQGPEKVTYGLYILRCHGNEPMFQGPIELTITFHMPTSQKKGKSGYHHTTPDLSNLIKFLEDAIVDTNAVISDDRLISSIIAKKIYGPEAKIEFTIRELE